MARVEMKGLHRVRMRGRTYFYAWRGGPRILAEEGTPAFAEAFAEAHASLKTGDPSKFSGLVAAYKASDRWAKPAAEGGLADSTKRRWKGWLDEIQVHFGLLSVKQFDRPEIRADIKKWRSKWKATPRSADYGKQVLSAVLSFGVDDGRLQANPCIGIKNLYSVDRSDRIWRPEDLEQLARTASPEIMAAARLAALTGLRQADLLRLAWSHVGDLAIERRTGKSRGKKVAIIPIYAELRELLEQLPKRATTILVNGAGLPWKSGFGSSWNKALIAAGFKGEGVADADLHFHDLRGTAATRMYVGGLSVREIAEILAWSEDEVERLIARYVNKDELLRDKIRRLDAASHGTRGEREV